MDVDVTYEGLILMRGVAITTTPNGPFIGFAAPMPVGTNLVLQREGASCTVRVARVEEGTSAGMFITPLEPLERLSPGAEVAPPASAMTAATTAAAPAAAPGSVETRQETANAADPPAAEVAAAADAPGEATASAAAPEIPEIPEAPAATAGSEAAPPEPLPASDPPARPEAVSGAVVQEMDPRLVTAPVDAGDILQEMPATDTGPVPVPSKNAGARDGEGDAGKKGRRRSPSRGGKKR